MSEKPVPEWIAAGAKVAVVQHRPGASREDVFLKDVQKVNPKSVTVDGDRYPLASLEVHLGGSYGTILRLADPNDATIRALLVEQRRRARAARAIDALQKWRDDPDRVDLVRDALARLTPYLPTDTTEPRP